MTFSRGSQWRKWDLHVHTPCSIIQHYGGDTDEAWEKFFIDLEGLPKEFGVLGINDYIFIDGYRKVLEAKQAGRLANIDLILPVVELRLDKFGGSGGHLSRANYHVIFSEEIGPDVIEQQFLNALQSSYQLSPQWEGKDIRWGGVATRASLEDLGNKIIASVPAAQRGKYGSPLIEGFNNLNYSLQKVQEVLSGPLFQGKVLTALGKAEWDAIKWNDHSIADKKNIINRTDFVFVSAESVAAHAKARLALTNGEVNDRLLDCSDAHRFSDSGDKDRIGKCFTWIKADPTFNGLIQTIHESSDRIFIGNVPPPLVSVRANPTKFVSSLEITKATGSSLDEPWFNGASISFNTGLVAVIGNKGSGKSALVDILGLLGDSRHQAGASFLNPKRFNPSRQPKGAQFEASLAWHDGTTERRLLSASVDPAAVGRVKYIPQNFFETVCNEIAAGEASAFDGEIKEVIFSHVPQDARLGRATLDDLIRIRTSEVERSITLLRAELQQLNRTILTLQSEASEAYRDGLVRQKDVKQAELSAHLARKPQEVAKPGEASDEVAREKMKLLEQARARLTKTNEDILRAGEEQKRLANLLIFADRAAEKITNFERESSHSLDSITKDLELISIPADTVLTFAISRGPLIAKRDALVAEKVTVDALLDEASPEGLPERRKVILREMEAIQVQLDEPGRRYEGYLDELREWNEAENCIKGTADTPETIAYFEDRIDRWSDLPMEISDLRQERLRLVRAIYQKLIEIKGVYEFLYRPVQEFIANHSIAQERFRLNFNVSITDTGFAGEFFSFVNQGVNGSFCGTEPGAERLRAILERYDFDTEQGTIDFLTEIEKNLAEDHRKEPRIAVHLAAQMKIRMAPEAFHDYLFGLGYLLPKYRLQMAGKNLAQLSPGEKGSLLLVFYLLVDRNDTPLLIDQPEENLDNQTIYSLLVPSIKEAKERRQIFVVTHNANIAVVCDAEQIIYAAHAPEARTITYVSGSIENPDINAKLVDVLEGTEPAFDNRRAKYGKV